MTYMVNFLQTKFEAEPLNKGQGHPFWYQSISHAYFLHAVSRVTFALWCTV